VFIDEETKPLLTWPEPQLAAHPNERAPQRTDR